MQLTEWVLPRACELFSIGIASTVSNLPNVQWMPENTESTTLWQAVLSLAPMDYIICTKGDNEVSTGILVCVID